MSELKPVSGNAALVEFPLDPWGFTSELRKAGLRAAQSVRGNAEKQALLFQTLRIIAAHAAARLDGDEQALVLRLAQIADRDPHNRRRVSVEGVPTPVDAVPVKPKKAPKTAE